jgi:hypothetical protein
MINEFQLAKAEDAIIQLADALGITELDVIQLLEDGMEFQSPIAGQLSKTNSYFLDEMKATFDCGCGH